MPFFVSSGDGGRTWSAKQAFSGPWPNVSPFGKIIVGGDGTALMSIYQMPTGKVAVLRSSDNGRTWGDSSPVATGAASDETQLLALPDGRLLSFTRMEGDPRFGLRLQESDDQGHTWVRARTLMKAAQWPFDATLLCKRSSVIELRLSAGTSRRWRGLEPGRRQDLG